MDSLLLEPAEPSGHLSLTVSVHDSNNMPPVEWLSDLTMTAMCHPQTSGLVSDVTSTPVSDVTSAISAQEFARTTQSGERSRMTLVGFEPTIPRGHIVGVVNVNR